MNILIPEPLKGTITVYSKSGCPFCEKIKKYLEDKQFLFTVIDCDAFVSNSEDKTAFLDFIRQIAGKEHKTFPMVFDESVFMGGYTESVKYLDNILEFNHTF
jgi:glutaredoxin